MQRMLCAAAAALALFVASADAAARPGVYYRTKCVGLYCWPMAEPTPHRHAAPPRGRRHIEARRLRPRLRDASASTMHGVGMYPDERWSRQSGSAPVAVARRYLGGNPTGWARAWCGAFMRLVMRAAGYPDLPSGDLAAAWTRYGRPSPPQPGAVVVWPHHVGLITALHGGGLATVISGNDGRRVRERVLSIARAVVRMPG
jgi:hypothetical protein